MCANIHLYDGANGNSGTGQTLVSGSSSGFLAGHAFRLLAGASEQDLKPDSPSPVASCAPRLAGSLGYSNDGYVHQKYPELCRTIGEKIALVKQDEPDKMRRALEDALHEHPAPTLSKLSGRLGYSSSNVLWAHEPELCEQLSARHRSHVIERRADLERRAAAALSESPAPSLLDVCKRLGTTVFFMNKYFPAVRQAIAEHHRQWVSSATAQRREKLSLDVRNIAAELQGLGLYPSVNKIVDRLPAGCCTEWKTITCAVREAREGLGFPR